MDHLQEVYLSGGQDGKRTVVFVIHSTWRSWRDKQEAAEQARNETRLVAARSAVCNLYRWYADHCGVRSSMATADLEACSGQAEGSDVVGVTWQDANRLDGVEGGLSIFV